VSRLLCDMVTGSAGDPSPELCGVPRRIGLQRPDGRYDVLCQSAAQWRIGMLHSCDRCLPAMAERALHDGRTETFLARVQRPAEPARHCWYCGAVHRPGSP